jgi:hypothetical protein
MMDTALPEAQERLRSLLKSKLTPLLGGMQLADGKLARRFADLPEGGALFFAENGVLIPHGDLEPTLVTSGLDRCIALAFLCSCWMQITQRSICARADHRYGE